MDKTRVLKDIENRCLIIERSFHASPEKVWCAYSEQAWFERWWGPQGWETQTKVFDFSVGGMIHYGMKCCDPEQTEWFGQESWGIMKFISITPLQSFTADDYFSDPEGSINPDMPAQRMTVELVPDGDQTVLITRSYTDSIEQLEELLKMGMVEGFSSQLDRLEEQLASADSAGGLHGS